MLWQDIDRFLCIEMGKVDLIRIKLGWNLLKAGYNYLTRLHGNFCNSNIFISNW